MSDAHPEEGEYRYRPRGPYKPRKAATNIEAARKSLLKLNAHIRDKTASIYSCEMSAARAAGAAVRLCEAWNYSPRQLQATLRLENATMRLLTRDDGPAARRLRQLHETACAAGETPENVVAVAAPKKMDTAAARQIARKAAQELIAALDALDAAEEPEPDALPPLEPEPEPEPDALPPLKG